MDFKEVVNKSVNFSDQAIKELLGDMKLQEILVSTYGKQKALTVHGSIIKEVENW